MFLRELLEYASEVWDGCNLSDTNKLEQVQLNAARIVTGLPVFSSLRSLYLETGWETLAERRKTKKFITRTSLYNVDPLEPHFYIVRLGFTGVYIIFLFLLKNIDCGYSLEPPRRGGSNEYPQSMFLAEIWKNIRIFI